MTLLSETRTVGFAEAKNAFSALTTQANDTGLPFIILKNNRPWVEVTPLAVQQKPKASVTITPVKREVCVADLDDLFADYRGSFVACEDEFAHAVGCEVM